MSTWITCPGNCARIPDTFVFWGLLCGTWHPHSSITECIVLSSAFIPAALIILIKAGARAWLNCRCNFLIWSWVRFVDCSSVLVTNTCSELSSVLSAIWLMSWVGSAVSGRLLKCLLKVLGSTITGTSLICSRKCPSPSRASLWSNVGVDSVKLVKLIFCLRVFQRGKRN